MGLGGDVEGQCSTPIHCKTEPYPSPLPMFPSLASVTLIAKFLFPRNKLRWNSSLFEEMKATCNSIKED